MLTVEDGSKIDWKNIPLDFCMRGNAMDTFYTYKIYEKLYEELEKIKLIKLYDRLINPLTSIFCEVENNGMDIVQENLIQLKHDISAKLDKISKELLVNPRIPEGTKLSGHDIIRILFSLERDKKTKEWNICPDIGFGLFPISWTAAGQPSTDSETMIELAELIQQEYARRGLNVKKV